MMQIQIHEVQEKKNEDILRKAKKSKDKALQEKKLYLMI